MFFENKNRLLRNLRICVQEALHTLLDEAAGEAYGFVLFDYTGLLISRVKVPSPLVVCLNTWLVFKKCARVRARVSTEMRGCASGGAIYELGLLCHD